MRRCSGTENRCLPPPVAGWQRAGDERSNPTARQCANHPDHSAESPGRAIVVTMCVVPSVLEARNLLTRHPDPQNRREVIVTLTDGAGRWWTTSWADTWSPGNDSSNPVDPAAQ